MTNPPEDGPQQPIQHLPDEPARAFRAATREIGRPVLSLRTDDCQPDAERHKAKGVVFVKEPARMDYGGMDAAFDDTFDNLNQPAPRLSIQSAFANVVCACGGASSSLNPCRHDG